MSDSIILTNALLRQVNKPSRYVAGELNSVVKTDQVAIRFALCFPDIYEIGMSNLAISILYQMMNERDDTWCERAFSPASDMRDEMLKRSIPLFSLESRTPLGDFDFIGFTLQYELSYITVLDMVRLAGLPLWAKDRGETDPILIGGGPCAVNAEPIAEFFDLILVGEAEYRLSDLLDLYRSCESKSEFLRLAGQEEGVYVPAFYEEVRDEAGRRSGFDVSESLASLPVKRTIVSDLNEAFLPEKPIVPNQEIVHDRMMLELFRGCSRGCRFCQAGQTYRPVRERRADLLAAQAEKLAKATGYDELGLLSLSTSDYSELGCLIEMILPSLSSCGINLSLPSLRLDNFSFDLMEKVSATRKAGLTFAIEAGSQRMRDRINKNISEEDVLQAARIAFSGGWRTLKFYFMLGLPGETEDDVKAIADIVFKVIDEYYNLPKEARKKRPTITISTSYFIPKPWTPFQWEAILPPTEYAARQKLLTTLLRHRFIRYNWHDADMSVIEAVLSRGDRRLGRVLETVVERGGTLDSWREHFSFSRWQDALHQHGLRSDMYTCARDTDEVFAWDFIDMGVTKSHLLNEKKAAEVNQKSDDCMTSCSFCGANTYRCGVCLKHEG